jgi:hypothetical protein
MNIIIKIAKPREVLKNKKISATKTKEARGVDKQRNKNSKTRRGKRCQQAKEQKEGTKVKK